MRRLSLAPVVHRGLGRGVLVALHLHQPTQKLQLQHQNTCLYWTFPVRDASAEVLSVRQKSIISMDRYTTEAYLCPFAHAETYGTDSPELPLGDAQSVK